MPTPLWGWSGQDHQWQLFLVLLSYEPPICEEHGLAFSPFSIWSPDGFVHSPSCCHGCRGVAVAPVCFHTISLTGETGIDQVVSCCGTRARGQHPSWRALSSCHHGELVRPGGCTIVQVVGGGIGLERSTLVLGGAGVRWGKVGVVEPSGCWHAGHTEATDSCSGWCRCVREGRRHGARVMHSWVWKPALGQAW